MAGVRAWHRAYVSYHPHRCLAAITPHVGCQRCVDACPVMAIGVGPTGIVANGSCIGCGRCAIPCPTAAIDVAGLPATVADQPVEKPIVVECARVPAALMTPGATRLPCLGALSAGDLLGVRADAGDRPIHLIDHGWCGACSAGGDAHPARQSIDEVAAILVGMGAPSLAPELVRRPVSRRWRDRPSAQDGIDQPDRRRLIHRLIHTRAEDSVADAPVQRGAGDATSLEPRAVQRHAVALNRLSTRLAAPIPSAAEPAIVVSDACRNDQVCSRVCPTGALAVEAADDGDILRFEAARCIACGACARYCPERAVTLTTRRRAATDATDHVILAQHRRYTCRVCRRTVAEPGDDAVCRECRTSRTLAIEVAALRSGAARTASERPTMAAGCDTQTPGPTSGRNRERLSWTV